MVPDADVDTAALDLPPRVGEARAALEDQLARWGWSGDVDDVLIAVHEALINADRHGGGVRAVRATFEAGRLVVEVADHGAGFDAAVYTDVEPDLLAERGRGLWLIDQLASDLSLREDGAGVCVILTFLTGRGGPRTHVAPPVRHPPSLAEAGGTLLEGLRAALVAVDAGLAVREVNPAFAELFGLADESVVGRELRGVTAELKQHFTDPTAFENRLLEIFAHPEVASDDLVVLRDGRLLRQHSVPLLVDDEVVGRAVAFLPVMETTQLLADMQRQLLPAVPAWDDLEVGALYHAAEAGSFVGGDFYDFIELAAGGRCLVVGDVSGRGTSAAAAGTSARAYLRSALAAGGTTSAVGDVEAALVHEFGPEQFVTMALCVEDSKDVWTIANCGHVPVLLLRDGALQRFETRGPVLGFGLDHTRGREPFGMRAGDVLLLYTDGVLDAGRGHQRFGQERLEEALRELGSLPADELVAAIDERLHAYAGTTIDDDHVLVAVRRG